MAAIAVKTHSQRRRGLVIGRRIELWNGSRILKKMMFQSIKSDSGRTHGQNLSGCWKETSVLLPLVGLSEIPD